jgi:hypothetical protein
LQSKDPNVRAAVVAYGDSGQKNGFHVGFFDLKGQGIKGEVDPSNSGKGKLGPKKTIRKSDTGFPFR